MFYLHGSRSKLSSVSVDADWDFAVQWSPAIESSFTEAGFTKLDNSEYTFDDNTVCIFEDNTVPGKKIQYSLRKDLDLYKKVWESIDSKFYEDYLWKRSSKFIGKVQLRDYLNQRYKEVSSV